MAMSGCLLVLSGCNANKYHAELYDNLGQYINEDFAKKNVLWGVTYYEDRNDSIPKKLTFTADNNEELREIFKDDFDFEIDFNSQILFVYTYTTTNIGKLNLKNIELKDNSLIIDYRAESKFSDRFIVDTCSPYQRWIAVKMDKVEFDSVTWRNK